MSTVDAIAIGIMAGLLVTAIRVVWVVWTTRIYRIGDYALAAIIWWHDRRTKR